MSRFPSDSAIASPRTTRQTSMSERRPFAPVTPQRTNRSQKARAVSTPLTPSTSSVVSSPFTPITNVYSSVSTFVSPDSSVSTKVEFSPEVLKSKARSVADSTHNWRSRTKENGMLFIGEENSTDDIPASFLTTHRRSRQAMFQANSTDGTAFISPKTARMPVDGDVPVPIMSSLSSSILNTPEPARSLYGPFGLTTPSPRSSIAIVQKLRQRGSLTDPARPRRRHISGPVMGENLFDINEDEPSTIPYPQMFGSPFGGSRVQDYFPISSKRSVSAPFIAGRFFEGYEEEELDEQLEDDGLPTSRPLKRNHSNRTVSSQSAPPKTPADDDVSKPKEKACSVCSASSSPLSTLLPCEHLICSSCLTGALNIIGEKDMRCASCDKPVNDFKLLMPLNINSITKTIAEKEKDEADENKEEEASSLLPSAFEELSVKDETDKIQERPGTRTPSLRSISGEFKDTLAVLRIDNVPWDITPPRLTEFFAPHTAIRAHVMLDPRGKTLSHAYVEVPSVDARDALRAVQNKSLGKGKRLRGVTVTMSSQSELMRGLFPSWHGSFEGSHPTLDGLDHHVRVRALENGLITLSEIEALLGLMKNPKSHYLKVPTLPFYTLVSIISKFPADSDSRVFYSGKLRDLLFELTNAACDLLVNRTGTDLHDQNALDSLVSAAVHSQVFTDTQRFMLHGRMNDAVSDKSGELNCNPPEAELSIANHLAMHSPSEDSLSPEDSASSVSTTSVRAGRDQRGLGYGRPGPMRNPDKTYPFQTSMSYASSPPNLYANLASPQLNSPPGLGFSQLNMGLPGMPFVLNNGPQSPYDALAMEFGVEPDLVAALAQRLAFSGQSAMAAQSLGGFHYAAGRM